MKRISFWLLLFMMLLGCFAGCVGNSVVGLLTSKNDDTAEKTEPPTEETTTGKTKDNTMYLYYDDRKPLSKLFEKDVTSFEIRDQKVISNVVGTTTADTAVLTYDEEKKRVIATGIGTATVVVDGVEYPFEVKPAPISLVLITGHSLGEGFKGSFTESVVCEGGQAYSSTLVYDLFSSANDKMGLGYYAESRPWGIDAFTKDTARGAGRPGVGAALAEQWNRLTGEKVWVLNAAADGSCINEWKKTDANHIHAMNLLNAAATVVKQEVVAGHYEFKDMAVIYFSGANFYNKNVIYNDQNLFDTDVKAWYNSLWIGFQEGVTIDIDGDNKVDAPTTLGLVPIWETMITTNESDIGYRLNKYMFDKPITFYMTASGEFPYAFTATNISSGWMTDTDVKSNFPEFDYEVQSGATLKMPTKMTDVIADQVHLTQIGYNAAGLDIAKNLYAFLRTNNAAERIKVLNITTNLKGDEVNGYLTIYAGRECRLVFVSEPIASANFKIEVSSNMTMTYPGVLTAENIGTGTITISHSSKVIKTINVTIK